MSARTMKPSMLRVVGASLVVSVLVAAGCSGADSADRPATTSSTTKAKSAVSSTTSTTVPTSTTTTSTTSSTTTTPATTTTAKATAPTGSLSGVSVVIDPGHNGRNGRNPSVINRMVDAGGFTKACNTTGTAGADGYTESAYNWQAAQVVAAALRQAGATVTLTRTSDDGVGPCVDERGQTSQRVGADVLISIHADGSTGAGNHGFHVIHPGVLKGYTDTTAKDSERLAVLLRDQLVAGGWSPSNYIGSGGLDRRSDLGTLNRSPVPSIMLESGNMRNAADLEFLESAAAKSSLATAVVAALLKYGG